MNIIHRIQTRLPELVSLRRNIHAHPETAFEEIRTAELVAAYLEGLGLEVHRGLAKTGVVGILRKGNAVGKHARAIGLRADMDALPVTEKNTFSHCSVNKGKMHACGHDGHTAMLLGAAACLSEISEADPFEGTVYFIFQPAEEHIGGGRVMVEEGLFERFPMDAVFGLHNWPSLAAGKMSVVPGPVMASADIFEIIVTGCGAHAAMPHQGFDPIVVASAIVQALQSIASRTMDPLEAFVLSVTQFHAGDADNVIPDRAILRGTVRAFKSDMQALAQRHIRLISENIAAGFHAQATVTYEHGYPPTLNSAAEAVICQEAAVSTVGAGNVLTNLPPSMGAEDFAYMLQARPGCYVWLGAGGGDQGESGCMLHNPRYDFNDDILPIGISYWLRLVERWFQRQTVLETE